MVPTDNLSEEIYETTQEEYTLRIKLTLEAIDLYNAIDVRKAFYEALESSKTQIEIDMANVTSIDSSGIATLNVFRDQGKEIRIINVHPRLRHRFRFVLADFTAKNITFAISAAAEA